MTINFNNMENNNLKHEAHDDTNNVLASVVYGCPQCGSKNYKEEGNNKHQTDDEMEYLEYYKCQDCGQGFVL